MKHILRHPLRNLCRWALLGASIALAITSQSAEGQALGPAAPCAIPGVDCLGSGCQCEATWDQMGPILWQQYGPGEYVGLPRTRQVPEYRLRVDDQLEFVYRVTRDRTTKPYELNVGDEIQVESFADERLRRALIIQPDGTITLGLLGQVPAAGKTVDQLRQDLDRRYKKFYNTPAITVTPLRVNTKLEDLRATVDGRLGFGGQTFQARIAPDGTVSLPAIPRVPSQGLTLVELKREINAMYEVEVEGIEVIPVLVQKAQRFVYVVGEVPTPGRFAIDTPTTVIQAISLAGGWNVGANLNDVVVFRRADDWRLLATKLDLRGALYARRPCPADEIWLSDSDIVVVPKGNCLQTDEWINLVFTRGIYALLPGQATAISFSHAGRL